MSSEISPVSSSCSEAAVEGELSRRLLAWPLRMAAIVTGFALLRAIWSLLARFGLGLRRRAFARVSGGVMTVDERWTILGKQVRAHRTTAPLSGLGDVRLENRTGYASLVAGCGFLVAGLWCGVHWILEGLGAGSPVLFLIGAGAVVAGALADVALYLFVPGGVGRSRMRLGLGRYELRLCGVDKERASEFIDCVARQWAQREHPSKQA
ncbi:MAG: hypothetical protein MUC50_00945 [Myxococcota bacterium]|jgi:hypothetical protein|nr:hypothetical protein [Myxococcota bacterium]